jgi:predicted acyltransferase
MATTDVVTAEEPIVAETAVAEPATPPPRTDEPSPSHAPPEAGKPVSTRLHSLDAARGLAIVVMLVAMNPGPVGAFPDWLRHPRWEGLSFIDLFFPLFLFVVGVSMTLSRRAVNAGHVLRRAVVLFALGVALGSLKHQQFWVTGVLQHIAGAYVLAYAVLRAPRRWHLPLAATVLVGLWVAFVVWADGGDPWGTSGTLAHALDGRLIGRFSTEGTLQTVMSTVTVLGGAFAGYLIRALPDRRQLVRALAVRAGALMALGLLIALSVPINKRLWSPSFAVLTVGTSFALLAVGVWIADVRRAHRPIAPLVHLGTNPITVYVLFLASLSLLRNYAEPVLPTLAPMGGATADVAIYAVVWTIFWWGFAYLLYRRRIFLKL